MVAVDEAGCVKTFPSQVQAKKPRRGDAEHDCKGTAAAAVCRLSKMKPKVTTFVLSVIRQKYIYFFLLMWNLQGKQ